MSELGAIFYRGPSLLTGDPIVGILTGLEGGSMNAKTGHQTIQAWILRADRLPMDAKRANLDDAICGDCKLRGRDGKNSGCYITVWHAPTNVYKRFMRGGYVEASWPELRAFVEGRSLRLGAYGDPAAVPFEIWRLMTSAAAGWIGYTHAWKRCDQRLKTIVMASVDNTREAYSAWAGGWRTFRIRLPRDPLLALDGVPLECICPASDEGDHRATCEQCQLCQGTAKPARSVAILAHGKPSNLKVFGLNVSGAFGRSLRLEASA